MQSRLIDPAGPAVPALGLGCMGMSSNYGPADQDESLATLHHALELGVAHFDTSASYGDGRNEELLARFLPGNRDRVFLATKFAIRRDGGVHRVDSSPGWARQSCENSLRRLGVDVIDLFYLHRRNPDVPIEDTVAAMADLVTQGKVRHLGLSEVGAETIRRAHAVHPISALQIEYSLFSRDIEDEVLPVCRELGIRIVAYSPVGRGLLTGTIQSTAGLADSDNRLNHPRFAVGNLDHNLALVDRIRDIAGAAGCTPAQVAIAWVLAQGDDVHAIPGTTRRTHLAENVAAADVVLTAEQLAALSGLGTAAGARLSAFAQAMVGH
ncbi:aldo/keto reductase [Catellatospora paridis]|uniref:aldo/keto reductase n=1 Tax=Catellatospora paridis TaxID=1617086 RepID=UPI0012D49CA6|nr:aldo/keto reductase [Catellatospora paridis]